MEEKEFRGSVPLCQVLQGEIFFPTCLPGKVHLEQGLKQSMAGSNNIQQLNKNPFLPFGNDLYLPESSFK